jgi:glycosyltransferase involved in cell wall biosynthesis
VDRPRPTVSVVIPTHDRATIVERAICSVLAQTRPALEILVVDDGSTDDTAARLERYVDQTVRVLRLAERVGGSRARNIGIEAARGDWVAFLDSDDEWRPRKLERQLARLGAPDGAGLGVIYCRKVMHDHLNGRESLVRTRLCNGDVLLPLLSGWEISTSQVMVTRAALSQVGGFDPELPASQDYDLWLRLAAAGHRFGGVAEAMTVKHVHLVAQMAGDPSLKERGLAILERKWRPMIVARFGAGQYRRWLAARRRVVGHSYLMRVREAAARGRRREAWRHLRAMVHAGPFAARFMVRALALVLLGWPAYAVSARAWRRVQRIAHAWDRELD